MANSMAHALDEISEYQKVKFFPMMHHREEHDFEEHV